MGGLYIWQDPEWPQMIWKDEKLSAVLAEVNQLRGVLLGRISMFGYEDQNESLLDTLTQEIVHSSEIEGERFNRDSVRSSIARQLGIPFVGLTHDNHNVEGVVQVMLDATHNFDQSLTKERLFGWHSALFPNGYSGPYKITVADWRQGEEPMQVVSGAFGREKVHYEAPPSEEMDSMMSQLIDFVNEDSTKCDPLVKAAITHLWFVTIHPFDDGNGRLARTITELLLAKADHTSRRYYSLSTEILNHRKDYYDQLERSQKGSLDVTDWVIWFLETLRGALLSAIDKTEHVIAKVRFWDKHKDFSFNERQRKVLNLLLNGFEGKLTSSKWYKINHCSQDTANRDLCDLVAKGVLECNGKGRNTSYQLVKDIEL